MAARSKLLGLLPWLLCACALTLLGLAAGVRIVGARGAWDEDTFSAVVEALGFIGFPLVGAVIAARLPAHPYGWVWCGLGLAYGVLVLSAALAEGRVQSAWSLTAVAHLAYLCLAGLLVFVFLLFPTGRLPSRRWRWLPRATVLVVLLLAAMTPSTPSVIHPDATGPWAPPGLAGRLLADVAIAGVFVLLALVVLAMASVVLRFRLAGPVERSQLKWFLLAAVVNAAYGVVDLVVGIPVGDGAWVLTEVIAYSLIPAAVGIAVLRYRLYEIDRVISRTVSYGLLTAALIGLYLLVVTLLRPLLEPLTGSSALAVAGSTLAVAAVANPARRRLQAVVDRRFDRARYDARRAVAAFAERLRDQVDLDQVSTGLRDTVAATVAPTRVAVWLRIPSRPDGA